MHFIAAEAYDGVEYVVCFVERFGDGFVVCFLLNEFMYRFSLCDQCLDRGIDVGGY